MRSTTLALFPILFLITSTLSIQAQHTFSIVAVDSATNFVGVAGATCLDSTTLLPHGAQIIGGVIPGMGAMNAQASVCVPINHNLENGLIQIAMGFNSQQTLDVLLANDMCSPDTANRQYGIATFDSLGVPNIAAFTGAGAMVYRNHKVGFEYSVQGNILTGSVVLDSMEAYYLNATGTLADRLMAALQGAKRPGADRRCFEPDSVAGVSSHSAFIRVAAPGDISPNYTVDLYVVNQPDAYDPIDGLQIMYDVWKTGDCTNTKAIFTTSADTVDLFQQIQITDASTKTVYRRWDMGNTTIHTDNRVDFIHWYSTEGVFVIELIAKTLNCSDTTTKTITVIQGWTGGNDLHKPQRYVKTYPNPFTDRVTFQFKAPAQHATLKLYDIFGRELYRFEDIGSSLLIERDGLANGIYFWQLSSKGRILTHGKIAAN